MPHHVNHHHHVAHEERDAANGVATEYSVVYVTAAPTFAGPVGSYSTPTISQQSGAPNFFDGAGSSGVQNAPLAAGGAGAGAAQQPAAPAPVQSNQGKGVASSASAAPTSSVVASSSAPVSSASSQTEANFAVGTPLKQQQTTLASSISAAPSSSQGTAATAQTTAAPAPTAVQTENDGGLSGGAKAGIAIGMILFAAILAVVGFIFYRKKKSIDASNAAADNEKTQPAPLTREAPVTSPNNGAPRLSFKPNNDSFGQEMNEKQAAAGGLAPVAAPTTRGRTHEPTTAAKEEEKTDPFSDNAKLPQVASAALAPKPLNVSRPESPETKNANGAAAGGAPRGPNGEVLNVYRVHMEFKPSMDDELELLQGQVVRMMHEYDDGWCLCMRLDRSQQGVVPRSCLSKAPVKPRSPNQRPRGPPPAGAAPAPLNVSRPQTPTDGPFGAGEYRSVSPQGRPSYDPSTLSNSPNHSPPSSPESNQAPIARKPAPGDSA